MVDHLCLVVCQNLRREVAAILHMEGFDDVVVATFPGRCGDAPVGLDTLVGAVRDQAGDCERMQWVCGPCCAHQETSGNDWRKLRVHWVDRCADLLVGSRILESYLQRGAFLLIPGWLSDWRQRLEQGLDRATARECFKATTRLLLLDSGVGEAGPEYFQEFARLVGLPGDVLPVGLDFFRLFLTGIVLDWRLSNEKSKSTGALSEAIRRSSDHAMALDLIGSLARTVTEAEAVENILDLFTLLFAAGRLVYLTWVDGHAGQVQCRPAIQPEAVPLDQLTSLEGDYARTETGNGFLLRISLQEETLGFLLVSEIAFPEYIEHYLSLARILGRVCGLTIANARAYEKARQAEEIVHHQAFHDTLTGVPNRLSFNERLSAALARVQRSQQVLAVLFVDLDHFKLVNDTFGHDSGDELLKEVTRRLQDLLRTDDTVARMGGDEFLVLLPEISQPEDALRVAQRIHDGLRPPFHCGGHDIRITASVGVALYPQDGQDAETLVKSADAAMYRVKETGRDGYRMCQEG